MLEYRRAQNSGCPLHGCVFVCVGSAEVVELVEKFPGMVVVVLGEPEMTVTVFDEVDMVDLECVSVALGAMLREEEIVDDPRVIFDEKDWYVPVGVLCSVIDRV